MGVYNSSILGIARVHFIVISGRRMGYIANDMALGMSGNEGYPKMAVLVGQINDKLCGFGLPYLKINPDVTLFLCIYIF